ncbi:MAG: Holliday junction resolvase RuvX [Myxococcota bacterium]
MVVNLPPLGRVMAVDWGGARLGIAVSDPTRTLATPHSTLAEKDKGLQIRRVAALVTELEAVLVLVGIPRHLDGNASDTTVTAEKYATKLATVIAPIPVVRVDERLSTVEAEEKLAATSRRPSQKQKGLVDRAAAAVLLQAWLDAQPRPTSTTTAPALPAPLTEPEP